MTNTNMNSNVLNSDWVISSFHNEILLGLEK